MNVTLVLTSFFVMSINSFSFAQTLPFQAGCPGQSFGMVESNGGVAAILDQRAGTYRMTNLAPPKIATLAQYYCWNGHFHASIVNATDGNNCVYDGPVSYGRTMYLGQIVYGTSSGVQACGNGNFAFSGNFYQ
jgi:hypothetical protein